MKGTKQLIDELLNEGFRITHGYLEWLLRERFIAPPEKGPGGARIWRREDIARLKNELIRRGRKSAEEEKMSHGDACDGRRKEQQNGTAKRV